MPKRWLGEALQISLPLVSSLISDSASVVSDLSLFTLTFFRNSWCFCDNLPSFLPAVEIFPKAVFSACLCWLVSTVILVDFRRAGNTFSVDLKIVMYGVCRYF